MFIVVNIVVVDLFSFFIVVFAVLSINVVMFKTIDVIVVMNIIVMLGPWFIIISGGVANFDYKSMNTSLMLITLGCRFFKISIFTP